MGNYPPNNYPPVNGFDGFKYRDLAVMVLGRWEAMLLTRVCSGLPCFLALSDTVLV